MTFRKSLMALALCFVFIQVTIAQNFLEATESFSRKKPSYITLQDGTELEAEFRNVKTKKGLFLKVWVDDGKDKKREILAEDIKHMYLPASGWDIMAKALDMDATKLDDDTSLNQELVQDGYAYFETVEVMVKKKKKTALMQLLNPAYANNVRVYNDPWANEQQGLGIKGIQVAGGGAKSYYVKVGDKTAFIVKKKNYSDMFKDIFVSCKSFVKKNSKPRWKDFEQQVYDHSKGCDD